MPGSGRLLQHRRRDSTHHRIVRPVLPVGRPVGIHNHVDRNPDGTRKTSEPIILSSYEKPHIQTIISLTMEMNIDNVKAQMRKGTLEYCILLILSRGASYAPKIIEELKRAEMIVVEGTI